MGGLPDDHQLQWEIFYLTEAVKSNIVPDDNRLGPTLDYCCYLNDLSSDLRQI